MTDVHNIFSPSNLFNLVKLNNLFNAYGFKKTIYNADQKFNIERITQHNLYILKKNKLIYMANFIFFLFIELFIRFSKIIVPINCYEWNYCYLISKLSKLLDKIID